MSSAMGRTHKAKPERPEKPARERAAAGKMQPGPKSTRSTECRGEPAAGDVSDDSDMDINPWGEQSLHSYISQLPTKSEIKEMLQELTSVIKEEMRDIKRDMSVLAERTEFAETNISKLSLNQKIYEHISHQNEAIQELRRQLEDQENRSRRNNIRIINCNYPISLRYRKFA
ncbi:hypothetical protein XELAEV_18028310mg [Xenopus laevis]|uniref:Uncharacterized protein n=1 Tax=Xenopus laevis TaxID=8355 RepID=A0A974CZ64_XENLA|nr:hypothetical protein XELAEV_18028310mg [Xenopus laevis]